MTINRTIDVKASFQSATRATNIGCAAYENFQPDIYRYDFNSNAKWTHLKDGVLETDGYASKFQLRGKNDARYLAIDLPGGPASRQSQQWKTNFNVKDTRVIVADWRGVGLHEPVGCVLDNTAQKLVADIEALRCSCAQYPDERLILRGGSWGATMAAAYAAQYPEKVAGLVLGLPFLARAQDVEWNYGPEGLARRLPDAFDRFADYASSSNTLALIAAYLKGMQSSDTDTLTEAFVRWTEWEYARNGEQFQADLSAIPDLDTRIARAKIMAHYTMNNFTYADGEGIAASLKGIPSDIPLYVIAHTQDPLCAPDTLQIIRDCLPQAYFMIKEADWHWVAAENERPDRGFDNNFVKQGYPFACQRITLELSGQLQAPQKNLYAHTGGANDYRMP